MNADLNPLDCDSLGRGLGQGDFERLLPHEGGRCGQKN